MSSVFDTLFQGSPPPSVTSSTTSEQGFPDWYQELMRANIGQAVAASSQPYQPYPGQQIANPTGATNQAYGLTESNVGSANPSLNQASGALGQVASGFNQDTANQYLAPYTGAENSVTSSIQALGDQNLMQNILPGVNDAFTGAGQFGSTRNANFNSLAIENAQMGISNAQSQALMSGTQAGMANYLQGNQNQLFAGQQLGTLGQIYQNTGLKDASALDQIGQEQQAQTQSGLNVAYQNYQNQLAYPYNNTNFLNSIIRGMPAPTQSSGTAIAPQTMFQGQGSGTSSPLGGAISTGGAAAGLGGLAGSSVSGTPMIFREGGRVHHMAAGGATSDEMLNDIFTNIAQAGGMSGGAAQSSASPAAAQAASSGQAPQQQPSPMAQMAAMSAPQAAPAPAAVIPQTAPVAPAILGMSSPLTSLTPMRKGGRVHKKKARRR